LTKLSSQCINVVPHTRDTQHARLKWWNTNQFSHIHHCVTVCLHRVRQHSR